MCYFRTQYCEIRCYSYILLFSNILTQNLVAKNNDIYFIHWLDI